MRPVEYVRSYSRERRESTSIARGFLVAVLLCLPIEALLILFLLHVLT